MNGTVTYACPNCGAGLAFDAEQQKFACEFCLSSFTKEELSAEAAEEKAEENRRANEEFCAGMNAYVCQSCGAEVTSDEHTVADFCCFCHNPVVLSGKLSGQMRPDKIIPFSYDKEEAEKKFLAYTKKKWFLPKAFFAPDQAQKIRGVYYPFWVTDADTNVHMRANATRVRTWRQGDVQYTETSRFMIVREGDLHFEDLVSSATTEAEKNMLEGILPFPSDSLKDFSMPYLAGFLAKKRNIERSELTGEVRDRMNRYAKTLLEDTIHGYNSVLVSDLDMDIKKSHWEYALMPIWLLTYHKNGKVFTYAMNGHTGKVYGKLPVSLPKLAILGGSIFAALSALFIVLGGML